jgi:hypothetical protein
VLPVAHEFIVAQRTAMSIEGNLINRLTARADSRSPQEYLLALTVLASYLRVAQGAIFYCSAVGS